MWIKIRIRQTRWIRRIRRVRQIRQIRRVRQVRRIRRIHVLKIAKFRFYETFTVPNFVTRILLIETLFNFRTIKCCFNLYFYKYHICFRLV